MFDSKLPLKIDWDEINVLLNKNHIIVNNILSSNWLDNELFKNDTISANSLEVLKCLYAMG